MNSDDGAGDRRDEHTPDAPDSPEFLRFKGLARKLMSVPKAEYEKQHQEWERKQRPKRRYTH